MALKLFISQPMRGKTDEEILEERNKAVQHVKDALGEDIEVIDSFFTGSTFTPLECIENTCAVEYGINCIMAK